jgi:hypothetical protein
MDSTKYASILVKPEKRARLKVLAARKEAPMIELLDKVLTDYLESQGA